MSNNATEPKGGNRTVVIGIAVVLGMLAGGGAGAFFAGPLLANRATPAAEHAEEGAEEAAADEAHAEEESAEGEEHAEPEEHAAPDEEHAEAPAQGGHAAGGAATPQAMFVMENVVLNPARSNGTRFLMATVAFGMRNEAGVTEIQGRELEVRDRVLRVLGAKTVLELADVAKRDSLKVELQDSVGVLFRKGAIRGVYFPQFVIQ